MLHAWIHLEMYLKVNEECQSPCVYGALWLAQRRTSGKDVWLDLLRVLYKGRDGTIMHLLGVPPRRVVFEQVK